MLSDAREHLLAEGSEAPPRLRVAGVAAAACIAAIALTLTWTGDDVDYAVVAAVVVAAAILAWTVRFPALAGFWDRLGPLVGAVLTAGLVAATGGAESNYQDMFGSTR